MKIEATDNRPVGTTYNEKVIDCTKKRWYSG
jgi:hypothetical protein